MKKNVLPNHPGSNESVTQSTRRDFMKALAATAAGLTFSSVSGVSGSVADTLPLPLGVCTSYQNAALLKQLGFSFVEENVGRFLIPESGDSGYEQNKKLLETTAFPIHSYITLLPSSMKTVGPEAHHEAILSRVDLALKRARECNSKVIVFGSGSSRNIPDGFDRAKAKAQHIELTRKMAPLAEKHGVAIAVEPLNRTETNFINSLAEGVEIVEAVNNPWVRLQCDIYHMLKDNESPQEIITYARHIVHCHIAEREKRTSPGEFKDDFKPYFRALKKINYQGGLAIEANWKNFDEEAARGIATLNQQLQAL